METTELRKDIIRYIEDAEFSADLTASVLSADHTTEFAESSFAFSSDSQLVAYLGASVCEVLERTAGAGSAHRETFLFARNSRLLGEISATMELVGELSAVVAISFPRRLARLLTARIAACKPEELSEADLLDGVGELVNQISGKARTYFEEKGQQVKIGLPQSLCGVGLPFEYRGNSSCYALIFKCLDYCFALQISPTASVPITGSR